MKVTRVDTGLIMESSRSFDKAAMSKATEKPHTLTSKDYDELYNMITELQREYVELRDKITWLSNQGKVGTVWVIEKERKNE